MNLFRLILENFGPKLVIALLLSGLSAAFGVQVMAFINESIIHHPAVGRGDLILFAGYLAGMFVISSGAQILMTRMGHQLVYQLRRTLVKQVLDTDCERLEQVGTARLLASLNSDTGHITAAFICLPHAVYGLALTAGTLAYLAWLSPPLFGAIAGWLLFAIVVGWVLMKRTHRHIQGGRDMEDCLYEDYQAVIDGRKELWLNRHRARLVFEDEFVPHARRGRDHEIYADALGALNENWVNAMILGGLGLSFFLAHRYAWADTATATTYAMTILFLRTPLASAVSAIPGLAAGNVALDKIRSLELSSYAPMFVPSGAPVPGDWARLELDSIEYAYPAGGDEHGFTVGPLNLHLERGETVFLIGGNGSGKSTLARLLTGIYRPTRGEIHIDRHLIGDARRAGYHDLFSTVYSDFHLFDHLLGPGGEPASAERIMRWLRALGLEKKSRIDAGRLSDRRLSQGQRKRLALLLALLEDRPVIVLDEWAADQDPSFRRAFYTQLLPDLKAAGKTIFAITHDEHYFDMADRILKMDGGRLYDISGATRDAAIGFVTRLVP